MRAVVIERLGGAEVLQLKELERPQPGPGEVLVQVVCAGVNPADWKCREGYLGAFLDYRFPFVLGFDLAGTVVALGEGVDDLPLGSRVFAQSDVGAGKWGSYAEYACVSRASLVAMPENLDFAAAAAVPTPALAAWTGLLEEGALRPGQTVLVHGGGSAVGGFAIQFARCAGARIATTCSADNAGQAKASGAELAIDYRAGDIHGALRRWAPEGVDLVLDCIGGGSLPNGLDLLRPGGALVAILTLAPGDAGPDHAEAARRGLRTAVAYSRMPSGELLGRIASLLAAGRVRPPALDLLPLSDVASAHDRLQHGHARRKQVLQVAG
ncbi:NADP-dependent oxidoreductase [Metapseudomonas lalkuanensis]|uniref:NADP-dependent oxidoreductase n=1 Tax=Metapseudomonas lalkuanensis TaxID=2604832 RepID=A0A5J6QJY4_9GAMM|nr:NADP-dependent oxidoreductase [Pseudomonas lalkuanensis]QEY61581.1 NADP-dependent oxidoreductase [Pseudomonas lalkuanensis]